jgi:YfiH family protein
MWTLDASAPVPLWRSTDRGAVLAASTRQGGVSRGPYHALNLGRSTADDPSAVAENRRRVLATLELAPDHLATAGQVHGARIVRVDAPGHAPDCDALLTTRPGLALAVTTADCMSILLATRGAVAVAHSGWRGTAAGMPAVALAAVCAAAGVGPEAVRVHLGPCIRACCYEVGEEVAGSFPEAAVRRGAGRPHLDLPRAAQLQLEAAGLPAAGFFDSGACTACDAGLYYSYRRDGAVTGRHWGVAALAGS